MARKNVICTKVFNGMRKTLEFGDVSENKVKAIVKKYTEEGYEVIVK